MLVSVSCHHTLLCQGAVQTLDIDEYETYMKASAFDSMDILSMTGEMQTISQVIRQLDVT